MIGDQGGSGKRPFLAPLELFAVLLCLFLIFFFAWYQAQGVFYAYDFTTYLWAGAGDLSVHYYAFWILPFFQLLAALPPTISFILLNLLNLIGVFCAARVFSGRAALPLLTYQMFYTLYYGNIIGILMGGLALLWWGMGRGRWHVAGLGLVLAGTKYQLGATLGLLLWLLAPVTWRQRGRVLLVPLAVLLLSLVLYPLWPLTSLAIIRQNPPDALGNISLWQWVGALALLLWLPPLLLPLQRPSRLIALTATAALTVPYFQQTDLLALFMLPVGWLPLLGNVGFWLFAQYGHVGLKALVVIPAIVYVWQLIRPLQAWANGRFSGE